MKNKLLILTEDDGAIRTLDIILEKITLGCEQEYDIRKTSIDPFASEKAILVELRKDYKRLMKNKSGGERFKKVLLVIDFEDQKMCVDERKRVFDKCVKSVFSEFQCEVVFKHKKYENWLISDPNAFAKVSGYELSKKQINDVIPGKADNIDDAEQFLNQAKKSGRYHKINDPRKIVHELDIREMEKNSRSFRKLLKEVGVEKYKDKSSKKYIPTFSL